MSIPLLLHSVATFYMIGLIWFVQVVHYPLFGQIGEPNFVSCQRFHLDRVGWVVGPAMIVETLTAGFLIWTNPGSALLKLGGVLLALIWLSTWLLQVPKHHSLESGFDSGAHRHLVSWNWIRTIAWTMRGFVVCGVLIS